ncbi:MAG TPA: CYTH domain-containing protein, partial [Gemmatimonadales bacterium]|nr:CYTH domain-containing protein [Gemmatimonadales bacterium]
MTEHRWEVPNAARLEELVTTPLPLGLRPGPTRRAFYRDLYFDTPDGDLRRRAATCRLRFDAEDRRSLALHVAGVSDSEARVPELEPSQVFAGDSEPARRLRALVDPIRLAVETELQVERRFRLARLPLLLVPQFVLAYDGVTLHGASPGTPSPTFHELVVSRRPWAVMAAARFARAVERDHGLAPAQLSRAERAARLLGAGEGAMDAAGSPARRVALLAVAHGRLALCRSGAALQLAQGDGGGEEACRRVLRGVFGSVEGEVRLLGVVPAAGRRPAIEVWLVRRLRRDLSAAAPRGVQWFAPHDIVARVGSPVLRDPVTLAALAVAARSELVPEWSATPLVPSARPDPARERAGGTTDETSRLTLSELRLPALPRKVLESARPAPEQFINALLSALEFN